MSIYNIFISRKRLLRSHLRKGLFIRKADIMCSVDITLCTLQWRHNGIDGVSLHQPRHYLLSRLFGRRSKKTSKLYVTGLCAGNSPVTGEFPAQMASNAENVSIWWRHHEKLRLDWADSIGKMTMGGGGPHIDPKFSMWLHVYQRTNGQNLYILAKRFGILNFIRVSPWL